MPHHHTESVERFVWPPRQPGAAAPIPHVSASVNADAAVPIDPRLPRMNQPTVDDRPRTECVNDPPLPVVARPPATRWRRLYAAVADMVREAERTWLDVRSPVLHERMVALRWQPDVSDVYCRRCGQSVGPHQATADGCVGCDGTRRPWKQIVRLGSYVPPLTRLVQEVKFMQWRRLGMDLGYLLGDAMAAAVAAAQAADPAFPKEIVVVPVPTTFWRRMQRGIDHSTVIARAVAKRVDGVVAGRVVGRTHRPSQLEVMPSERASNVAGTFWPRSGHRTDLSGKLVVVVDDVTTTGATLRGTCRAIRAASKYGAKRSGNIRGVPPVIWVGVIAVAEQRSMR